MVDEMDKRWVCPECDGDSTVSEGPCDDCLEGKVDSDISASVIREYISQTGDDDLSDIDEAYAGSFQSDEEFAQDMADNISSYDPRDLHWPLTCIDWEHAARELMYDYFSIDGYYFRNL